MCTCTRKYRCPCTCTYLGVKPLPPSLQLTTALVELYQTLSPVVQQANELTAAVDEHMTVVGSWVTLMKEGAHSCQEREQQRENDQPTESELD